MSKNFAYKGKFIRYKDNGKNGNGKYHRGYVSNEDDYTIFITEDMCYTNIVKAIRKKDIGSHVSIELFDEYPRTEGEKAKERLKEKWNNKSTLGKVGVGAAVVGGILGLCVIKELIDYHRW